MRLFLGRLKVGDKWITVLDYELTHCMGARVMTWSLSYEHFKLKSHDGIT